MIPETPIQLLRILFPEWSSEECAAVALATVRLTGFLCAIPLFSSRLLPLRMRAGFAILFITVVALSAPRTLSSWGASAAMAIPASGETLVAWAPLLVGVASVGLVLGWSLFLLLGAVRAAAAFLSEQIGFSIGGVMDPSTTSGLTALLSFHTTLTLFLFVSLDLHFAALRLFLDSLRWLPPGTFVSDAPWAELGLVVVEASSGLFEAVLTLALPVTVTLLLVSLAQGVLSRALPELELFALGFPLRIFVGLAVLVVTLPFTARTTAMFLERAIEASDGWVRQWAG